MSVYTALFTFGKVQNNLIYYVATPICISCKTANQLLILNIKLTHKLKRKHFWYLVHGIAFSPVVKISTTILFDDQLTQQKRIRFSLFAFSKAFSDFYEKAGILHTCTVVHRNRRETTADVWYSFAALETGSEREGRSFAGWMAP